MRSLTFLARMTIFGCLLSTIPVIFIGIFAYVTASKEIQKNVNDSQLQLISQINSNVEQKLTTVNHTLNQVLASTVLKHAIATSLDGTNFMLYDDLRNEISHMQSFDTKLEDVILINERYNWLIKNSGLYVFDQFEHYDQFMTLLNEPSREPWILTPTSWFYSEETARSTSACAFNISLIKTLPANSLDSFGMALANIPTCSLQEMIVQDSDSYSNVIVIDNNATIIIHEDSQYIGQKIDQLGIPLQLFTRESGQFNETIDHKDYAITYMTSTLNDWTYISTSSIQEMMHESRKIGMYTLYICVGLIVISVLFVWLGSKQLYVPIQRLLLQIGEPYLKDRSKKTTEFQLISERVHYLFESKSELEHEVQQHIHQVRTLFFLKAYQGNIKNNEIKTQLHQFGYAQQLTGWQAMATLAIQIDFTPNSSHTVQDIDLLLFAINNVVEELIPSEQRLASIILDESVVLVIGAYDKDPTVFHNLKYGITEHLQQKIKDILSLKISIGISLPYYEFSGMSIAYRESLEALKHRMILGEGIIIQYDQMNDNKHFLQLSYPFHIENELLDTIKLAEVDKAKVLLTQFLQMIFQEERSPQEYQFPLSRLLNTLVISMQESGINLHQPQSRRGSLIEQLLKIQHKHEIESWFWRHVIEPSIAIYRDRQEAQFHNLSEKIIDLVQQYYDTDLTLEECASRLHYNANYLSSVFRKETNVSFSEYLSMYRFKMAKKWLSESTIPIKDIAAKLRYNNPQNFIRSFRKQEGMTPGQYREKFKST